MSNQHSSWSNQFTASTSVSSTQHSIALDDITDLRYFIEGFVLHQKSRGHSQRTIASYLDRLPCFVWFLQQYGYPTELESVTANVVRTFLIYLTEQTRGRWGSSNPGANRPLAQSTVHGYAKVLRAFFRWATLEAGLSHNPFSNVRMPSLPNQWKVETFTDEEISKLFEAVDKAGTPPPRRCTATACAGQHYRRC